MLILIAGPYRSVTNDDTKLMQLNLNKLEAAALPIFRKGNIAMIREWVALPLIIPQVLQNQGMKHGRKLNILLPIAFL